MEYLKIEHPEHFCKDVKTITEEKCTVSLKLESEEIWGMDQFTAKDIEDTNEQKIVESIKSETFEMPSHIFERKNCSNVTESWKLEYAEIEQNLAKKSMGLKKGILHHCTHCEYKTFYKSTLANHNRIHMSEKPFKCQTCGTKFTRKGDLDSHQQRHSGDKLFQCTHCEYKTPKKSNL